MLLFRLGKVARASIAECGPILNAGLYTHLHEACIATSTAAGGISQSQPQVHSKWGSKSQSKSKPALILDGRTVSQQWTAELTKEVELVTQALGRPPGLGVLLVGNRPDSVLYVTRKLEACTRVGINAQIVRLPAETTQQVLEETVSELCQSPTVDGVLIQLPLPKHLDEEAAMDHLDACKDVDGFHPTNMGRILMRGRSGRFVPCTPLGCLELLQRSGIKVQGKTAVMLGDSNIVGTPLASLIRDRGAAAVTVCHRMSYHELYEADDWVMAKRSAAAACLPRLPGPGLKRLAVQSDSKFYTDHINHAAASTDINELSCLNAGSAADAELQPCFNAHQLHEITRTADILVVAVGQPELVRAHWVKPGAVVLDVGINVVPASRSHASLADHAPLPSNHHQSPSQSPDQAPGQPAAGNADRSIGHHAAAATGQVASGHSESHSKVQLPSSSAAAGLASHGSERDCPPMQILGDVAFDEVIQVASAISPVPGGVGPMTIAAVLHNTLQAARYHAGMEVW